VNCGCFERFWVGASGARSAMRVLVQNDWLQERLVKRKRALRVSAFVSDFPFLLLRGLLALSFGFFRHYFSLKLQLSRFSI
jgi:hypothetical protein